MSNLNFSYPTDDYPELGDPLDPEPLRRNFEVFVSHALRHQDGEPDELDASRLAGQGHNSGFNADMLDGLHTTEILSQVRSIVQEVLQGGTGDTTTKTESQITQITPESVVLFSQNDQTIEINQGDNNSSDPYNENFNDEPAGTGTTFISHKQYEVIFEFSFPTYFSSIQSLQINKVDPDLDQGERYQGLFLPFSTSTDGNGNPIEEPEIINTNLEQQKVKFRAILPSDITYEDSQGNQQLAIQDGDFVDEPQRFSWKMEATGEVPVVEGHAQRHKEGGLDPIRVDELPGQGHTNGFNADFIDGLHASDIARVSANSPSSVSFPTFGLRSSNLFINVWYESAHNGLMVGIVSADDPIGAEIRIDITPSDTFIDQSEIVESRIMGVSLRDDGNSTAQPNNSPNFATSSGRISSIHIFEDTPKIEEEIEIDIDIVNEGTSTIEGEVHYGSMLNVGSFSSDDAQNLLAFDLFTKLTDVTQLQIGGQ